MREGLRQRARRGFLLAAVSCLALSFAPTSSGAQEDDPDAAPRPEVFRSAADSLVASVQIDREALLPVPDLFKFIALDGSGVYETSTRSARASIFFPGNGVILGPGLACGTFGAQFPPEFKPILDACLAFKYPLSVVADDFEPDAATQGSIALGSPGDPVSGNGARASAHAGEDATTTDAVIQDLVVGGLPDLASLVPPLSDLELDSTVVRIDNAASRTDQRIVDGSLVTLAEATVSGISLVGGLIDIGAVRSVSKITDDAVGTRTAQADLEVSGVTVAGMPAQLTEDGAVVIEPAGGGPLVQQQQAVLNELLRNLDVRITSLATEEALDEDGAARANVGGLLVEFAQDVQGLPTDGADPNGLYEASIQLARTGVVGAAFSVPLDEVVVPLPPDLGSGGDVPPIDAGALGDVSVPPLDVAAPPTPPPAPPIDDGGDEAPQQLARRIGDLFGDRLGLLYLAMAFAVLAVCTAPRFAVPARFPRP